MFDSLGFVKQQQQQQKASIPRYVYYMGGQMVTIVIFAPG